MFDFIRTHRRLMQFVLLLFIFPSFAFFGLEGYTRMSGDRDTVARVGGQKISRLELEAVQRQQMDRLREMVGNQFDPRLLDTPEARREILDGLIVQRLLALEAADGKLNVSDQVLQQAILEIPGLTGEDGRFDVERYKELLAMQGYAPAQFEASVRHDLVMQQVSEAVQGTAISPRVVSERLSDLNDQVREVQVQDFPVSEFLSKAQVTDEMLKQYYESNSGQFTVPAQVDVEYVVLSQESFAKRIEVSEGDIKSYYEQNRARFGEPEQRRASHILISAAADASASDREAARKKAEEVLAEARKNPDAFAQLARQHSQDPGSAEQGGDLDFFARGMMVKSFEDATFALEKGQISDVVESEFGYHIIKLTDIRPGTVRPLEEVRDRVVAEIRQQQVSRQFTSAAEQFTNMVYEQSDSLKPVTDELRLEIRKAEGLTRTPNPQADADAAINHARVLEALFSDEAIKNKRNTEAVEVAPGTLVSARVLAYRPQTTRPFEEVEALVRERVRQQEAEKLARAAGEERLKALREGATAEGFGAAQQVSRVNAQGVPQAALVEVMKANTDKLPAYVGVELPQQGYAVYRINSVSRPQTPDTARRTVEQRQIANVVAQQEMHAYLEALKKKYEVEVLLPATSARTNEDN